MNVKPRRRKKRKGGGFSWSTYWTTRTPSALLLTVLSDTSIKLDWTNAGTEDFDGHSIEISTDGTNYTAVHTVAAGINTFTDTGLTGKTLYYYRVRAYKVAEGVTQYSEYCNVVSATTDYLPSDIADGYFWLKADAITGLNDGDAVPTWEDSFATNNDAAEATNRPSYQTSEINGLPVIRGDGTNDRLYKYPVNKNQPITVYALINPGLKEGNFLSLGDIAFSCGKAVTKFRATVNAGTALASQATDKVYNSTFIISAVVNGANSAIYVDGGFGNIGNAGTNNADRLYLLIDKSSSTYIDADIAELIGYGAAHDATTRRRMEEYLAHKYNVELEPI